MILNVNNSEYNPNLFERSNNYCDNTPAVVLTDFEIAFHLAFVQITAIHGFIQNVCIWDSECTAAPAPHVEEYIKTIPGQCKRVNEQDPCSNYIPPERARLCAH